MNIYPAILTQSIKEAQEQILAVIPIDEIETVQVDVMDGSLVDNLTITPLDLVEIDFGRLSIDLHILTDEPLDYVYEAVSIQRPKLPIRSIIGQVEHLTGQLAFVEEVKKHHWQAGLSLDFNTALELIDDEVWEQLDIIQLMGIEMGFQNQPFKPTVVEKIIELNQELRLRNLEPEIIIDGGVKASNILALKAAGAKGVAVGSFLWKADSVEEAVVELLNSASA